MAENVLIGSRVVVMAYLLLVPFAPAVLAWLPHDVARLAQVVVAAICSAVLVAHLVLRAHSAPLRLPRAALPLSVGLTAMLVLVTLQAAKPVWALRELGLWVGMFAVASTVCVDRAGRVAIYWAAVASTGLYSAAALLVVVLGLLHGTAPLALEAAFGYSNVRFLNHVQTAALPLIAAGAATIAKDGRQRALVTATLVLGFTLLFFTGGRATGVAVLGGGLLTLLLTRGAGLSTLRRLLVTAVAGALLYAVVLRGGAIVLGLSSSGAGLIERAGQTGTAERRLQLWTWALEHAVGSPWWGIGPMHLAHHPNGVAAHPHNIYIQLLAEWGVPLTIFLMAMLGRLVWRFAKRVRASGRHGHEGVGWLVGVLAILIDGFASGNFVMPASQLWIAVLCGFAAQWWVGTSASIAQTAGQRAGWGWVVGAAALAAALLLWQAADALAQHGELRAINEASRALDASSSRMRPRYWSSGWF